MSVGYYQLKLCKCNTREERNNALIELCIELFTIYYEKFTETVNEQLLQFIKRWQSNGDVHYLHFFLKKIIKVHRKRLDEELNNKFNELKNFALNDRSLRSLNLKEDIDVDSITEYYEKQMNYLDSSMNKLIDNVKPYFERIIDNLNERKTSSYHLYETDFLSDTELEVRKKSDEVSRNKSGTELNDKKSYSQSELDNLLVSKNNHADEAVGLDILKSVMENYDKKSVLSFFKSNSNLNNSKSSSMGDDKTTVNESNIKNAKSQITLGMRCFALKDESYYRWQPAKIIRIFESSSDKTTYCVQFEHKFSLKRNNKLEINHEMDSDEYDIKELPATSVAFSEPIGDGYVLPIRSRIVTLYQNENEKKAPFFSAGTICELPKPLNLHRYLIFFDDGYAQYVKKNEAFPIFDSFSVIEDSLHQDHLKFLKRYFEKFPEKAMVRLHKDHILKTFYNGKWLTSKVIELDCSLAKLQFEESKHTEWLYRGSYRLHPFYEKLLQQEYNKNKKTSNKTSSARQHFGNVSIINNDIDSEFEESKPCCHLSLYASTLFPSAKKQTARKTTNSDSRPQILTNNINTQNGISKLQQGSIRQLDLQGIIRHEVIKFKPHPCTAGCVSQYERSLDKLVEFNLLMYPVACGWQRHIGHQSKESASRLRKSVYYISPCGRRLRNINEVDRYLFLTNSNLTIDMFSYDLFIHIDREFEATATYLNIKDIADGKDDIPISCVNCIDFERPELFEYSKYRVPQEGVPLNTNENLLEGCGCEDGCRDHLKCSCWRKTFEATTFAQKHQINTNVGYRGRRLSEMVNTGIFECNSNCKCDSRCCNRVVQNGTSARLQLFRASKKKGWGLRCLDDIPKGAFICIYTGHVMTEEQSDIRGKQLGDEYFAELDFVECLRRLREQENNSDVDDDIIDDDDDDDENEDGVNQNKSAAVLKSKSTNEIEQKSLVRSESNVIEYIYLNSDDEELKYQSSNSNSNIAQISHSNGSLLSRKKRNMSMNRNTTLSLLDNNRFFTNPKNSFYFKDYLKQSTVYIMDAKLCGNIGRYFNHSCSPNIFVQNVFVDTYDLRFPWIAFFSSQYIRAGTELCWDYNYTPNSVEGRVLYCYCGSSSCRGRLL